eukprot:scaffold67406_cov66-Phaeocystis_antarctica.AAC.3
MERALVRPGGGRQPRAARSDADTSGVRTRAAYAGLRRTRRGRATRTGTACGEGKRARGGAQPKSPTKILLTPQPGKRCEATAQSALGWYRPSVGVPQRRSAGTVVVVYFVQLFSTGDLFLLAITC